MFKRRRHVMTGQVVAYVTAWLIASTIYFKLIAQ
jgi:hypothetical protein